jgi:hypothetical protein
MARKKAAAPTEAETAEAPEGKPEKKGDRFSALESSLDLSTDSDRKIAALIAALRE